MPHDRERGARGGNRPTALPLPRRIVAGALLWAALAVTPAAADVPSCAGDCDGDGFVRIHELIGLVNSVLAPVCLIPEPEFCLMDPCFGADVDGDGLVTIPELIHAINRVVEAVNNSLDGCP